MAGDDPYEAAQQAAVAVLIGISRQQHADEAPTEEIPLTPSAPEVRNA